MARHLNYFCKFAPLRSLMTAARREIHNDTFVSCESLKKSGQFFRLGQSMAHSACGIVSKEHILRWGEPAVLEAVQSLLRDAGKPHLSFACQSDTNYTHTKTQEGFCILLLSPRFAVDGATGAPIFKSRPVGFGMAKLRRLFSERPARWAALCGCGLKKCLFEPFFPFSPPVVLPYESGRSGLDKQLIN